MRLPAHAGDALALGYNADGVWTAVTYYCSSTPKGGSDYKNEAEAREAAARDLKRRAAEGMVKMEIISASDRSGHFAYARGKAQAGKKDFHTVGFGSSKEEAEKQALQQLTAQGAKLEQKVFFNYFSHGADAQPASAKK
jgi:hypothetical protein